MKTKLQLVAAFFVLATGMKAIAQPSAGGIVYGPKGAFGISAPKGWKLDPTAGAGHGRILESEHRLTANDRE
jgi:hypothetical protein